MQLGYVTMRNEDGTQYATVEYGNIQWVETKGEAKPISRAVFDIMEAEQASTRKNDCGDNGFFGVYQLRFHPCEKRN